MLKNSLFFAFFALTIVFLVPKLGLAQSSERLGLHVTSGELAIWRDRAQNGPYGNDWSRIASNKDAFMADPDAELWEGYPDTECVPQGDTNPPVNSMGYYIRDAAFYSLVMDDATVRSQVYSTLVDQTNESGTDFSQRPPWCLDGDRLYDVAPGFMIAEWATRILFAYDYVRPYLSEAEKAPIEAWLSDAAYYFRVNADENLTEEYSDWLGGILNSSGEAKRGNYGTRGRNYLGGPYVNQLGQWYNNRRAHMTRFYTLTGIMLGEETPKAWGKRWVKEYLKYHIYADTSPVELYRSHGGDAAAGWAYSFQTYADVMDIVDAFARAGDTELYEYSTSEGSDVSDGGPKTVKFGADFFVATSEGDWLIYNYNTSESVENLIDGVRYSASGYYTYDTWLAQYNLYWQDSDITTAYLDPGPADKQGFTTELAADFGAMGSGRAYPGKLFMWGQMEGEVDPYGGGSSGGGDTNEAPTADFAFQTSDLAVEFSDQSSDSDGSIASWEWDLGDGATSDTQNPSHTYDTDGTYTVTLSVTDDQGASNSVTQDVSIGSADAGGGDLPEAWANRDVGSTEVTGSTSSSDDGNAFITEGGGWDIWDEADAFHFAHRKLEGDGVVTAQVTSQEATNPWAKAGVMIRESLSPDAKHAMTVVTPENGTAFQHRTQTSASSDHTPAPENGSWVRVERNGDTFVGFTSDDGTNWTEIDRVTIAMQEEVYVGLAVTSHEEGELSTARLEEVEVEADNADDGADTDPEPEPYDPPGDNLANGATHIDDSENFHADSPVNGFWDGDVSGEPEASPGNAVDQVWVEYDLGKGHELSEVRLFGDDGGDWASESFSVEVKNGHGQSYTTVIDAANARGNQWFTQELDDVKARYVRLTVTGDPYTQAREFEVYGTPTNLAESNSLTSLTFSVSQNHPNPFNGSTLISYQLPEAAEVSIEVFDMLGRHVATLVNDWQDAGQHEVTFEGQSLPSGTYLYRVRAGQHTETKQMVIVK